MFAIIFSGFLNFATCAAIEVKVDASDLAAPPNAMDREVYEFTVAGGRDGGGSPPQNDAKIAKEEK
ncbi:hypothetical protein J7M28_05345 [bacterium]|nr:hypothetical protein [bacterium]